MKKKLTIACAAAASAASAAAVCRIAALRFRRAHTFTLTAENGTAVRTEKIQPLTGVLHVRSDRDTDVLLTDAGNGETRRIGRLASGVTETIPLRKGRWYTIEGAGSLTVGPVKIRFE